MNVVAMLRRRYAGLVEIGHRYFREGDAERVNDIVDGMQGVEGELARARVQARAETAERLPIRTGSRRASPTTHRWVGPRTRPTSAL